MLTEEMSSKPSLLNAHWAAQNQDSSEGTTKSTKESETK